MAVPFNRVALQAFISGCSVLPRIQNNCFLTPSLHPFIVVFEVLIKLEEKLYIGIIPDCFQVNHLFLKGMLCLF